MDIKVINILKSINEQIKPHYIFNIVISPIIALLSIFIFYIYGQQWFQLDTINLMLDGIPILAAFIFSIMNKENVYSRLYNFMVLMVCIYACIRCVLFVFAYNFLL